MIIPVFTHTLKRLQAILRDSESSLFAAGQLIVYDPGLSFSILLKAIQLSRKAPISTLSKAISMLGAQQLEEHILMQNVYIEDDYRLLWCYCTLAGESAVQINDLVKLTDNETARLLGSLPSFGIILMSAIEPSYVKIFEQLLAMPNDDRYFIEKRLFSKTSIDLLMKTLNPLTDFMSIITLIQQQAIGALDKRQDLNEPNRFSEAYNNFRLFKLIEISGAVARAILFSTVIEAQEKAKELAKRHFRFFESELEELMSDVVLAFDNICGILDVKHYALDVMQRAELYVSSSLSFATLSPELNENIQRLMSAYSACQNIFIYGEPGTGKRLLAAMLHQQSHHHRRHKPFISVHCSTFDQETLEVELFGAKGGFMWFEKRKGALELANGGVLMLKDVDKIPFTLQEHLSNVFAKDSFIKVGDIISSEINIQLIFTSQKDLFEETEAGRFSKMLLDVVAPFKFYIPPLRQRRQDIPLIAEGIINKYKLNLNDKALKMGLEEFYDSEPFFNNLKDLKRLLFLLSAKNSLKS